MSKHAVFAHFLRLTESGCMMSIDSLNPQLKCN
jgi:hypothetical protein